MRHAAAGSTTEVESRRCNTLADFIHRSAGASRSVLQKHVHLVGVRIFLLHQEPGVWLAALELDEGEFPAQLLAVQDEFEVAVAQSIRQDLLAGSSTLMLAA